MNLLYLGVNNIYSLIDITLMLLVGQTVAEQT